MGVSENASRAAAEIQNPDWLKLLARIGFGAKGVVYLILGVLAVQGTAGGGTKGALSEIVRQPFGKIMLSVVMVGLAAYGLWRVLQSTLDPENEGREPKALGKRIGWFCSGLAYFALAFSAARIVLGGGGGGGDGAESGTQTLLSLPFGQWLVGIVGVGVLLAGAHQLKQAITADFREDFALRKMSGPEKTWATYAGHRYARELDAESIGDALPFRREITRLAVEPGASTEAASPAPQRASQHPATESAG